MISINKQKMAGLAFDFSWAVFALTRYFHPSLVDSRAVSMLKSIQSTIVPYSTTKVESSLNSTARLVIF